MISSSNICKCNYCYKQCGKTYQFECTHHICHICLYRELFCYYLHIFQHEDHIDVKCKCKDGMLRLSLDEIEEILKEKTFSDNAQVVEIYKDDIACSKHPSYCVNYYCVECSQLVCKLCAKLNDSEHFCHRIIPGKKMESTLQGSVLSLPLTMKTKEEFLNTFQNICKRVKDVAESNYVQVLEQLDELSIAMSRFKKQYEIEFKHGLANIVKKLNLYRMFYLHFYYDLEVVKHFPNLNMFRYLNNINEELIDAKISLDVNAEMKLSFIKKELDILRKSSEKKIAVNFDLKPVNRNYKLEEKLTNLHKDDITTVFQTRNELIVTGSIDCSIKFWEEDKVKGFNNVTTIDKTIGKITHLKELMDGKIVTVYHSENTLHIWIKSNNEYKVHQTLTGHKRTITSIAQLKNGKMISSSKDWSIIIWKHNNDDLFTMFQKIYENEFPILNMLCLFDNRFVSASQDTKLRFYTENELENTFTCTQILSGMVKPLYCWCQLKNGQILVSCESKVIARLKDIYENKQYYQVQKADNHSGEVVSIIQCKDGKVASSSEDHTIVIWDVKEKGEIVPIEMFCDSEHTVYNLIQLSDERLCGIVSKKEVLIWRKRNDAY